MGAARAARDSCPRALAFCAQQLVCLLFSGCCCRQYAASASAAISACILNQERNEWKIYCRHRRLQCSITRRSKGHALPPFKWYVSGVFSPATAAAITEGPAIVIVAHPAYNAHDAPVLHLLRTLLASARDAVRPLSARLTAAALETVVSAIPSNRAVTHRISRFSALPTTATATLAPARAAFDRRCYRHSRPAATTGVTTRRDYRHRRNCGKQLQKGEVLWKISSPDWPDCTSALGASLRCGAAEEAVQAAVTERVAAAQYARASHGIIVVLSTNAASGFQCHVKIELPRMVSNLNPPQSCQPAAGRPTWQNAAHDAIIASSGRGHPANTTFTTPRNILKVERRCKNGHSQAHIRAPAAGGGGCCCCQADPG
jgi:hypothetical protein